MECIFEFFLSLITGVLAGLIGINKVGLSTVERGDFGLLGDFGPTTIFCLSIMAFRRFILKFCYVYVVGNQYHTFGSNYNYIL